MHKSFFYFIKKNINNLFEAYVNLFLFFPYFFSIGPLLKTLFSPWKNLVSHNKKPGFSLEATLEDISLNTISCGIGFLMRLSMIVFFILLEAVYFITIPFIFILYIFLLPLLYLNYLLGKTDEEKKVILKKDFIARHLLKPENLSIVEQWFEWYYKELFTKTAWWKKENLFSLPPLARDWAVGFTPIVNQYSEEIISFNHPKFKNIVDRQKEITSIEQVLTKSGETNVVIVGEEGVGKHTVIDALAKKIYEGKTASSLAYKRLLKLNLEKILTQFIDQKQREDFLEDLFVEAATAKNIILMIENLDKYVADGPGRIDLTTVLEKYAKYNTVQFIGTTTPFFYQKFIFNNEKISRLFTKIDIHEVSENEAMEILLETAPYFEEKNRLFIPYETIKNTVEKSEFYITHIPFPEKAIDLLDSACSYFHLHRKTDKKEIIPVLLPDLIDTVLSEKTHIPTRLTEEMKQKLVGLETLLSQQVLYQEEAMEKLSAAIRRSFILLGKRKKPLASFLFLGSTGVGKTETAKALSRIFFGNEKYLVRFDMSLYQSKGDIPRLIGSIETNNPGLLSNAIRENPYAVLLLDEIEKADKDLINIFLTLLDEGYVTDGFGKKIDCKNLIVIATSNAGDDYQKYFAPEFLNRFDGVITYHLLTSQLLGVLAKKMIAKVIETLYKLHHVKIIVSEATIQNIIDKNTQTEYGARNLERTISQELENKISKLILENRVKEGDTIQL